MQGSQLSQSQRKAVKQNPQCVVRPEVFRKTIEILTSEKNAFVEVRADALRDVVEEYKATAMYKPDLLETLKPEIRKNLAFLHDYKQFVARVKQNINVVLQNRFPNDPDTAAESLKGRGCNILVCRVNG